MAGFLYFSPDVVSANPGEYPHPDLDSILGGSSVSVREILTEGPGDNKGCLFTMTKAMGKKAEPDSDKKGSRLKLRHQPGSQTWVESLTGKYWVGIDHEHPPTARDLERPQVISGYFLETKHGNFTVPTARILSEGCEIPHDRIFGVNGTISREVCQEYQSICAKADRVWDATKWQNKELFAKKDEPEPDEVVLSDLEGTQIALEALALNYHLGKDECNLLHLLGDDSVARVMWFLVDLPRVITGLVPDTLDEDTSESDAENRDLKKKETEPSNSVEAG